jgi:hypothetical protein
MSISITQDIPGEEQETSFMNATLQEGPPGFDFSVALHLDVPLIGVYDQESLASWITHKLAPISHDSRVHIEVQMGPARGD